LFLNLDLRYCCWQRGQRICSRGSAALGTPLDCSVSGRACQWFYIIVARWFGVLGFSAS